MRYKIVSKKFPEMPKVLRICGSCNKQYEVEVMTGDYHWPSFLECNSCGISFRYSEAVDYWEEKLATKELSYEQRKNDIESKIQPCPKCSGRFKHVDGALYGIPTHCPHCGISQEACNSPLEFNSIRDKDKIRYVSEDVYWLEVKKDEAESK